MVATYFLLTALSMAEPGAGSGGSVQQHHLPYCVVSAKFTQVPAQEAGVLVSLETEDGKPVEEGTQVQKGMLLGRIDDNESQVAKLIAEREYASAKAQADNDASVEAALATSGVAKAEFDRSVEIHRRSPGAMSEFELKRNELTWVRADKQWEVAKMEKVVAEMTQAVKEAQIQAAELDIRRRQIESPLEGEVVQVYKREGEWVAPGDAILRVVGLSELRVEGFVDATKFTPAQLYGKPVQITVHLPTGDVMFQGRIGYASPVVEDSGDFRIWASVQNRKENGQWVLGPGQIAEMSIDLSPATARR